jgi:hypothetical protein
LNATEVLIEIFTLIWHAGELWIVQPSQSDKALSWIIPHQPGTAPNAGVLRQIQRVYEGAFNPHSSIVHGTSWRYLKAEAPTRSDRLILTYAVILQPETSQLDALFQRNDLTVWRFDSAGLSFGDNLRPAQEISAVNIIAHALEHFALLAMRDPHIRETLSKDWKEFLSTKQPLPAGELGLETPTNNV